MEKDKRLMEVCDGVDLPRGKLSLVLLGRAMLSKSLIQFSVDEWSCVPPLLFTWGQIMVAVIKIMVTSLKRSHTCTATLSVPNPEAGHHWPLPPPATPGHPQASLGQSLVGSLLLFPGSWCTELLCPPRVYFPIRCNSGRSMVRLMATSSKRAYAIPRPTATRDPVPVADHCRPIPPQEKLKHSSVSLWGPWSWCAQTFSLSDTN